MIFGGQTVTFVSRVDGPTPDALGVYPKVETQTPVPGCRHRPLSFKETAEFDIDVATEMWKTTAPPEPAVLAAKPDDALIVDGKRYQIVGGPRHFVDMDGSPFKVTIISKLQHG